MLDRIQPTTAPYSPCKRTPRLQLRICSVNRAYIALACPTFIVMGLSRCLAIRAWSAGRGHGQHVGEQMVHRASGYDSLYAIYTALGMRLTQPLDQQCLRPCIPTIQHDCPSLAGHPQALDSFVDWRCWQRGVSWELLDHVLHALKVLCIRQLARKTGKAFHKGATCPHAEADSPRSALSKIPWQRDSLAPRDM